MKWLQVMLCMLLPVWASAATSESVFQQRLTQMSALPGFSCAFEQTLYFFDGGEQVYQGQLDVLRPGRFRWHYAQPYEQLYVSNGEVIWHYEPDLLQAERLQDLSAVDPVVMRLLDGQLSAEQIQVLDSTANRVWHIRITDGPELWLALRENGEIDWLESTDMVGNRNRLRFTDWQLHSPQAKILEFSAPEGVDVIELSGQVE